MTEQANFTMTRRQLIKGGGALVVTFGLPNSLVSSPQNCP